MHSSYAGRRYRRPRLLDTRLLLDCDDGALDRDDETLDRDDGALDRDDETFDRDDGGLDRDGETLERLRVGATEGVEGRLGAVTCGADDRLAERPRVCVGTWTDRVRAEREELWLAVGLTDRGGVRLGTRWVGVEGRTLRVGVLLGAELLGVFGGELERRRSVGEETLRCGGGTVRVGVRVVGVTVRVGSGELGGKVPRDAEVLRVVRDTSALWERVGAVCVFDVALVAGDVRTARPVTLRSAVEVATRRFLSAGTLAAASRSIRTLRTVALREDGAAAVLTLRERALEENLTRPCPPSRVTARARALTFVGPWISGPRITRRGE